MSLRIQQLNGDSTFLLTFSPPFAPEISKRYPGDFIILIDPWLSGSSSILHPTFQISHHTSTPALRSLNELNQHPDLIIISQDKPDHCHRETLCSLPKDTNISILAPPAAAKKIRSWKHFDEDIVRVMTPYSPNGQESVTRIALPGYSAASGDGEITIAHVPTKRDLTGVHNATGITYQPASTVLTENPQYIRNPAGSTITLPERGTSSAPASRHRSPTWSSDEQQVARDTLGTMSDSELTNLPAHSQGHLEFRVTPREQVLSVIYTPHGLSTRTLEPYIHNHLTQLNALPVSALFHSLNVDANPWFMGGVVVAGAPGGVQVAKRVEAKYWIGAHDELKDNRGLSTKLLKTQQYDVEKVEGMLGKAGVQGTKVFKLGVGEVLRIPELKKTAEEARRAVRKGKRGLKMSKGQRMNVEDNVLAMPEPKRPVTAPNVGRNGAGAVAPGTKVRIRREITDPDGRWI